MTTNERIEAIRLRWAKAQFIPLVDRPAALEDLKWLIEHLKLIEESHTRLRNMNILLEENL